MSCSNGQCQLHNEEAYSRRTMSLQLSWGSANGMQLLRTRQERHAKKLLMLSN
jgi:hypothetical protein